MALILNISNKSGFDSKSVSVGFVSKNPVDITFGSAATKVQPLNVNSSGTYPFAGNWYRLDQLSGGLAVNSFNGGRVYFAINTPWSVQGAEYEPAQNINDPNFYLRYDKMEMTFTGQPADVANLTSIDYWSIPLTLTTYNSSSKLVQTVYGLVGSTTAQNVYNALNALTTPPVSGLQKALPALVPGKFSSTYPAPPPPPPQPRPGTFARIIGPSSYPPFLPSPGGVPVTPYDTFENYLGYLLKTFGPGTTKGSVVPNLGGGQIATVAGTFAGVGPNVPPSGPTARQNYNLAATIDSKSNITLTGTMSAISGTQTMLYENADLVNASGIYGANAAFYLNGSTSATNPANDVYGWVTGDLLAGMNIGALGSQTKISGTPVGSMPSQQWFSIPITSLFASLQPSAGYYNQFAATMQPLSEAYNFAYSDRFAPVVASLNPAEVASLTVTIEPCAI